MIDVNNIIDADIESYIDDFAYRFVNDLRNKAKEKAQANNTDVVIVEYSQHDIIDALEAEIKITSSKMRSIIRDLSFLCDKAVYTRLQRNNYHMYENPTGYYQIEMTALLR